MFLVMALVRGRAVPLAVGTDWERNSQALRVALRETVRHHSDQGSQLPGREATRSVGESGREEEVSVLQVLCGVSSSSYHNFEALCMQPWILWPMAQHYISFRYIMFMHTLSTVLMVFCVRCLGCCSLTLALSPHSLRPQPGMCPSVYLLSLSQPSLSIELTLQGVCVSPEPSFLTTLMIQLDPPIVCIRRLLLRMCETHSNVCVCLHMCVLLVAE